MAYNANDVLDNILKTINNNKEKVKYLRDSYLSTSILETLKEMTIDEVAIYGKEQIDLFHEDVTLLIEILNDLDTGNTIIKHTDIYLDQKTSEESRLDIVVNKNISYVLNGNKTEVLNDVKERDSLLTEINAPVLVVLVHYTYDSTSKMSTKTELKIFIPEELEEENDRLDYADEEPTEEEIILAGGELEDNE